MRSVIVLSFLISIFSISILGTKIPRIIGGDSAYAGQFPFAVAIYKTMNDGRYFCGGALISNYWVLTAGQCVYQSISFTIQLGSNHLEKNDSNRIIVSTSDYEIHPNFNPDTLENDIGLIKLRQPVLYNEYLQRIQLAYDYTDDKTSLIGIGWGQTSNVADTLSEDLQYVSLVTISNEECKTIYGNQISDSMICVAGNSNEGTCTGDTGSPLVNNDPVSRSLRHVGIASFISGNGCENTDPSGYTKTYSYRDWIRNITSL